MRPTYSHPIGDIPINMLDRPHDHPPLNRRITTIPKPTRDALRAASPHEGAPSMLSDLLTTVAARLPAIPTTALISIRVALSVDLEVDIHVTGAAGPTLADALCDRARETTTATVVDGLTVRAHTTAPLTGLPGYRLVWVTVPALPV
jgi:hypothetical protein